MAASEAEEVSAEAPPVEEALLEAGRKQLKRRKTKDERQTTNYFYIIYETIIDCLRGTGGNIASSGTDHKGGNVGFS